jgi:hypothetical protein
MAVQGQNLRFEKHCSNGRFVIRKRTLREAEANGCLWPIPAVAIQSS